MDKIKILIIDDEKLIREGLKIILGSYSDIEVIDIGENGEEALNICREKNVDVVLMDIRMPICDGVMGTKLIKKEFPHIKVLILTTFKDTEYIHNAISYGASGYLLKDSSYDLIYEGIKSAHSGNVVVHPDIASKLVATQKNITQQINDIQEKFSLTDKEINIIKEISNGLTNKEIGQKLYLTEGTIKNNITTILSKLSLRDRTQIAIFAFKNNIIE